MANLMSKRRGWFYFAEIDILACFNGIKFELEQKMLISSAV